MKITIITAVFNGARCIADSLRSVASETHKDVEHIVVDGGSTDGTLEIVKTYQSSLAQVCSEPDDGLYDALNKGLKLAQGDIIGILSSDDCYAHVNVLSRVAAVFKDKTIDSCYGDLMYVDPINTDRVVRYWRAGPVKEKSFYWGWMPPHPTFFVRREIYEKYGGFNTDLGTAADYELMLRFLLLHRISTVYIPEVLVKMRTGGVSNASFKNRLRANRMDRKAWEVNGLKPHPWTLYLKPLRKLGQYAFHGNHRKK